MFFFFQPFLPHGRFCCCLPHLSVAILAKRPLSTSFPCLCSWLHWPDCHSLHHRTSKHQWILDYGDYQLSLLTNIFCTAMMFPLLSDYDTHLDCSLFNGTK